MNHPTDRIAHTTAFLTPVVEHWLEREIAQWKNRSDDHSHHEQTLLPRSYISLPLDTVSTKVLKAVFVAVCFIFYIKATAISMLRTNAC